ncbi:MAG: hypothetical protein HZC45_08855 [Deltaproteobacteria bacterium]|nr:hypothetical protein [Deltaproteobacteria bacterium]
MNVKTKDLTPYDLSSIGFIQEKLKEFNLDKSTQFVRVKPRQTVSIVYHEAGFKQGLAPERFEHGSNKNSHSRGHDVSGFAYKPLN